jgi:hypothetical protein
MDSAERLQVLLSRISLVHPRLEETNASAQHLIEEIRINLSRSVDSSRNPQQEQLSPTEVDQLLKDAAELANSDHLAEAELTLI